MVGGGRESENLEGGKSGGWYRQQRMAGEEGALTHGNVPVK